MNSIAPIRAASAASAHALDLSRDGITLYALGEAGVWRAVDRIELQIGTVSQSMAQLRNHLGGPATVRVAVDVWLPPEQVSLGQVPAGETPDTAFGAEAGTLAYAAGTDGWQAAVPLGVLDETRDFLQANGFAVAAIGLRDTPPGFEAAPVFSATAPAPTSAGKRRLALPLGLAAAAVAAVVAGTLVWTGAPPPEARPPVTDVRQIVLSPTTGQPMNRAYRPLGAIAQSQPADLATPPPLRLARTLPAIPTAPGRVTVGAVGVAGAAPAETGLGTGPAEEVQVAVAPPPPAPQAGAPDTAPDLSALRTAVAPPPALDLATPGRPPALTPDGSAPGLAVGSWVAASRAAEGPSLTRPARAKTAALDTATAPQPLAGDAAPAGRTAPPAGTRGARPSADPTPAQALVSALTPAVPQPQDPAIAPELQTRPGATQVRITGVGALSPVVAPGTPPVAAAPEGGDAPRTPAAASALASTAAAGDTLAPQQSPDQGRAQLSVAALAPATPDALPAVPAERATIAPRTAPQRLGLSGVEPDRVAAAQGVLRPAAVAAGPADAGPPPAPVANPSPTVPAPDRAIAETSAEPATATGEPAPRPAPLIGLAALDPFEPAIRALPAPPQRADRPTVPRGAPPLGTDPAAVTVFAERPPRVPPNRPSDLGPGVRVIAAAPPRTPPNRPVPEAAEEPLPGVTVVASAPEVIPPRRPGEADAPEAQTETDTEVADTEPAADPAPETTAEAVLAAIIPAPAQESAAEDPADVAGDDDVALAPSPNAIQSMAPPPRRPAAIAQAEAERQERLAALAPSDRALTRADRPPRRPREFAALSLPTPRVSTLRIPVPGTAVAPPAEARPGTPARTAPALPTTASVARAATIADAMPMRRMVLIGVYGSSNNRHALVRLANGRYVKVEPGDQVGGFQVASIGTDAIRVRRGGRDTVLEIPE